MSHTQSSRAPAPYSNPYLAGIGLGLVLLAAFVFVGRGLGASGAVSAVVTAGLNAVAPDHARSLEWLSGRLAGGERPLKDWLVFEGLGVFLGALISGLLARRAVIMVEKGPRVSTRGRLAGAFAGGALMACRRRVRARLHERSGADRRGAPQSGELGIHDDGVRGRVRGRGVHEVAVAMMAPFLKYGVFGGETSLVVAFLIGLGFGFALERAGFGSARKLVSQFYLNDMAVFKVMFTAIITAMLGVTYLSWIGVLDLSLVYLVPTFLLPQVVGGLILGAGFVVGGYCPGTALAATATGRLDAIVYGLGLYAGTFLFAELYPLFKPLHTATPMGQTTIPQYFNLPYGVVVFAVVLMAIGGFAGAGWVEKRMAARKQDNVVGSGQ